LVGGGPGDKPNHPVAASCQDSDLLGRFSRRPAAGRPDRRRGCRRPSTQVNAANRIPKMARFRGCFRRCPDGWLTVSEGTCLPRGAAALDNPLLSVEDALQDPRREVVADRARRRRDTAPDSLPDQRTLGRQPVLDRDHVREHGSLAALPVLRLDQVSHCPRTEVDLLITLGSLVSRPCEHHARTCAGPRARWVWSHLPYAFQIISVLLHRDPVPRHVLAAHLGRWTS
jgi:hypothetical protein